MTTPKDRKPRLLPQGSAPSTLQRRLRVHRRLLEVVEAAIDARDLRHHVGPGLGELAAETEERLDRSAEELIELIARLTVRDRPENGAPEGPSEI